MSIDAIIMNWLRTDVNKQKVQAMELSRPVYEFVYGNHTIYTNYNDDTFKHEVYAVINGHLFHIRTKEESNGTQK